MVSNRDSKKTLDTVKTFNRTADFARRLAHPALITALGVLRKTEKFTLNIEGRENLPDKNTPAIFVANHSGGTKSGGDIALVMEALKEYHMYPLIGEVIRDSVTNRILLDGVNGDVPIDRFDKKSRQDALREMIARVKNGQNILVFPEGSYNITAHLPTTPFFEGAAIIAQKTGAPIIPIAKDVDAHSCNMRIGAPIYAENFTDKTDDDGNIVVPVKKVITEVARTAINTMLWELWENSSKKWTKEEAQQHYEDLIRSEAWAGHPLFNIGKKDQLAVKREKGVTHPEEVDGVVLTGYNPYSMPNIYDHFGVGKK